MVKVDKVGCYLHGDGLANVIHSDGLANFNHPDYKGKLKKTNQVFTQENKQFDIVVSNPPYSVSAFKNAAREYYKDKDFDLYARLTDNSSEIECLFIERTKQLLKDGGVAGIILPSSILSNAGIYTKAREIILQYFDIIAITELGSNTFMATGTNTVVLFLRRKNNYDSINLRLSVEKFFSTHQDVTLNGIENPISKYLEYVWGGLNYIDYLSIIKRNPYDFIETECELYQEYRKKIKAKTEEEFWDTVLELEKEKLYYFILTYPQKVVLVKSGEKDAEKRFLGYEFSNRRGSEGIHPIQRGKTIDECTKLFDADVFDNPLKASTYIYKAFNGDLNFPIDESLEENISRANLVDILTFDRVDFEKNISLSIKKKIRIESRWEVKRLDEIALIEYGDRIVRKNEAGNLYPVYGGGNETFRADKFNRENRFVISRFGVSPECVRYVDGKFFLNDSGLTVFSKDEDLILQKFLDHYLCSNQQSIYTCSRGVAQKNLDMEAFNAFPVPAPQKDIQEKIVAEIEEITIKSDSAIKSICEINAEIDALLSDVKGDITTLENIAPFVTDSSKLENIALETYITTDNMLQNTLGVKPFVGEPNISSITKFNIGDILISNIRPYLKKIWLATFNGGCSKDVLVFRSRNKALYFPKYIYYMLRRDSFFDYVMEGKKGVKMPRGDKEKIIKFQIFIPPIAEQQKIVSEIETLERQIAEAQKVINSSAELKNAVLKKYL